MQYVTHKYELQFTSQQNNHCFKACTRECVMTSWRSPHHYEDGKSIINISIERNAIGRSKRSLKHDVSIQYDTNNTKERTC